MAGEAAFSKEFRDKIGPFGFRFYRVESGSTSPGIPDIHFVCNQGLLRKEGWIETKEVINLPKSIPYRPGQAPWLHEYACMGGIALTALWVRSERNLLLIPGIESHIAATNIKLLSSAVTLHIPRGGSWYPAAKWLMFVAK